MSTRLHHLAIHVRNLLDCDQACLCLYCPEPALHHPLLDAFPPTRGQAAPTYGSTLALSRERTLGLCAMALRSGSRINRGDVVHGNGTASIAIALLERPSGILGFLLCASSDPGAFQLGECRLLAQFLPELGRRVELVLSDSCTLEASCTPSASPASNMQEQNTFISMVSHELRVPLTAIKGYAGLLQAFDVAPHRGSETSTPGVMCTSRRQQYLNVIIEQTSHLEVLIGDVLDISRIQSGRLALHSTHLDVGQLCERVAQFMQARADQQQPGLHRIYCDIDANLPLAWADGDRVQQVLTNLLENAIKYSPAGGQVQVHVWQGNTEQHSDEPPFSLPSLYICVRDSGIGIPQQQQAALFEPFTRLEHPATRHVSGAGLGLYIARRLVEAMHGRLILRSHEGRGTNVTFSLPIATEEREGDESTLPFSEKRKGRDRLARRRE